MSKVELDEIFDKEYAHYVMQCRSKTRVFAKHLADKVSHTM
jgi:hypothetical protein